MIICDRCGTEIDSEESKSRRYSPEHFRWLRLMAEMDTYTVEGCWLKRNKIKPCRRKARRRSHVASAKSPFKQGWVCVQRTETFEKYAKDKRKQDRRKG